MTPNVPLLAHPEVLESWQLTAGQPGSATHDFR